MQLNILDIVEGTSVDGPGLRTAIYIAGCRHRCLGCHNPQSWDFASGTPMDIDAILAIVRRNDFNVTLSGGDPLYLPKEVALLCRRIKEELNKDIWCYTGFRWEEIMANLELQQPLPWLDVIVDGRFVESLRSTELHFRGSSNQRIIAVAPSLSSKHPILAKF